MQKSVLVLVAGFLLLSLGLSSCGKRGELEVPPTEEEQSSSVDHSDMMLIA